VNSFYRPPASRVVRPTRRRSGRRALVPGLLVLALAVSALAGVLVLKHHPRFAVTRIVLEGVPESRRAEAEALTDGLLGQPLLFADLDAAVAELSRRPWVERASARRLVPGTLVVSIVSRPPVALARRGDALWTVDRNGNALGPYEGRAVGAGDDFVVLEGDDGQIRAGAAFLGALKAEDPALVARLSDVTLTDRGLLVTDRVARIRLLFTRDASEPGRIAEAAASWRAALALLPQLVRLSLAPVEADLRFDGRIVLKAPPESVGRGKT
jgi:cell division septal protein FtsQ